MITFDEAAEMLDDISNSLPKEIYANLNGGVNLLPDVKFHSESRENDLYTLGEYFRDRDLGRYINIYYGSVMKLYGYMDQVQLKNKLRDILMHEFTHHLESMAGDRSLEIKDAEDMERYRRNH